MLFLSISRDPRALTRRQSSAPGLAAGAAVSGSPPRFYRHPHPGVCEILGTTSAAIPRGSRVVAMVQRPSSARPEDCRARASRTPSRNRSVLAGTEAGPPVASASQRHRRNPDSGSARPARGFPVRHALREWAAGGARVEQRGDLRRRQRSVFEGDIHQRSFEVTPVRSVRAVVFEPSRSELTVREWRALGRARAFVDESAIEVERGAVSVVRNREMVPVRIEDRALARRPCPGCQFGHEPPGASSPVSSGGSDPQSVASSRTAGNAYYRLSCVGTVPRAPVEPAE